MIRLIGARQLEATNMNAALRPKVAIVEDDGAMAYLFSEICMAAGCEVVGMAASADEALEILAANPADYLILDFGLNGERNGLELLAVAKQAYPDLFTILITAWDINDIAARLGHARPDRIMRKPVHTHLLIELLQNASAARSDMCDRAILQSEGADAEPS